jgi:hypothetical protein
VSSGAVVAGCGPRTGEMTAPIRPATAVLPRLPEVQIPFESSERAGLGQEEELQLIDRQTRELSAGGVAGGGAG